MTLTTLVVLFSVVVGYLPHAILYAPTGQLPVMWRNIGRYIIGVAIVLLEVAIVITLEPEMNAWQTYGITALMFVMSGLGVGLGYTVNGHD